MLTTVALLIIGIFVAPLLPAVGAYLPVFGISCEFIAMVVFSAAALTFRGKTDALFGMEWRRIKRLVAIGTNWLPDFHSLGLQL